MTYPLTEKQKEMADCADSHSYLGTQEKFGIGRNQVKYLRGKRNRIEREKEADNGEAIRPAMAFIDADLGMHRIADRKTAGLGSPRRAFIPPGLLSVSFFRLFPFLLHRLFLSFGEPHRFRELRRIGKEVSQFLRIGEVLMVRQHVFHVSHRVEAVEDGRLDHREHHRRVATPPSLTENMLAFFTILTLRTVRSAALFVMGTFPSSRKRR